MSNLECYLILAEFVSYLQWMFDSHGIQQSLLNDDNPIEPLLSYWQPDMGTGQVRQGITAIEIYWPL